ncbi:hypothetical protein CHUAL_003288 [Chamberlinius hualienensis]
MFQQSEFLINYKDIIRRLWEDEEKEIVSSEQIMGVLDNTDVLLRACNDINALIVKVTLQMNVDLIIALITRKPEQFDNNLLRCFLTLWTNWKDQLTSFLSAIFTVRNIYMLYHHSRDIKCTWSKFIMLTLKLIEYNLVSKDSFVDSFVTIKQQTWTDNFRSLLKSYEECITSKKSVWIHA